MSAINIDSKSILVDALKINNEDFQLSNLILPNKKAMRSVYEIYNLESALLEFAKNPEVGISMLGPPPKPPKIDGMTEDEQEVARIKFAELQKMYEDQKTAYSMHVPYADYIMIQQYLSKFRKTLVSTAAVKGRRFYAFTKNVEEQPQGIFGNLFNRRPAGQQVS